MTETTTNGYITRDDLLAGFVRRFDEFLLPNGKRVRIRNLNEQEKSRIDTAAVDYKKSRITRDKATKSRALLIINCLVGADDKRLLRDSDLDHFVLVSDSRDIDIIYRKCLEWVGGEESDFEELVGNSSEADGEEH